MHNNLPHASAWLEAHTRIPAHAPYSFVPAELQGVIQQVRAEGGDGAVARLHRSLFRLFVSNFASRFEEKRAARKLPESVRETTFIELKRIEAELDSNPDEFYRFGNDLFEKDLGILTFKLIPAGAQLVEFGSSVPKSYAIQRELSATLRAAAFFGIKTRGFSPVFQIHTSDKCLGEFNTEGWDRCYLRIADLLELHPEVKAMYGESWFYDPALERVSPRLLYLRSRPEQNGALVVRAGRDEHSTQDALRTSPTRRKLHEEGGYQPTRYAVIWARQDLLRFARASFATNARTLPVGEPA